MTPPHDLPTFTLSFTADDRRLLLEALRLHRDTFPNGYRSTRLADMFEAAAPSSDAPQPPLTRFAAPHGIKLMVVDDSIPTAILEKTELFYLASEVEADRARR